MSNWASPLPTSRTSASLLVPSATTSTDRVDATTLTPFTPASSKRCATRDHNSCTSMVTRASTVICCGLILSSNGYCVNSSSASIAVCSCGRNGTIGHRLRIISQSGYHAAVVIADFYSLPQALAYRCLQSLSDRFTASRRDAQQETCFHNTVERFTHGAWNRSEPVYMVTHRPVIIQNRARGILLFDISHTPSKKRYPVVVSIRYRSAPLPSSFARWLWILGRPLNVEKRSGGKYAGQTQALPDALDRFFLHLRISPLNRTPPTGAQPMKHRQTLGSQ